MKSLNRDRRKVFVSLYSTKTKVTDGGVWTGEWQVRRSEPYPIYPTLSANKGEAYAESFGTNISYDKVATIDYVDTGISETAVLWVDTPPQFDEQGYLVVDENGDPSVPFDYTVEKVAESPNVTQLAIKKVDVS